MEQWKIDPKVIEHLKGCIKKNSSAVHVFVAGKGALTWKEVLKEVERGTGFGRSYHEALRRSLEAPLNYFR